MSLNGDVWCVQGGVHGGAQDAGRTGGAEALRRGQGAGHTILAHLPIGPSTHTENVPSETSLQRGERGKGDGENPTGTKAHSKHKHDEVQGRVTFLLTHDRSLEGVKILLMITTARGSVGLQFCKLLCDH